MDYPRSVFKSKNFTIGYSFLTRLAGFAQARGAHDSNISAKLANPPLPHLVASRGFRSLPNIFTKNRGPVALLAPACARQPIDIHTGQ